ncbi:MAG TPA: hypothetical protein PKD34_02605 [Candidatus Doudnabacteria bacterium]|nr:hypothetical protein [Candidatus Doudnabacteria bacterium]
MKSSEKTVNSDTWSTSGQLGAKRLLSSFLALPDSSTLPHAFIFLGPSGVGKFKLAEEFAIKIAQVWNNQSEKYVYDFSEDNGLDELRELIKLSSLTSVGEGRKIFILKNFELASSSSVNALLKTLEEPSRGSMFLLVSNTNGALPTIMSRAIAVRCFPLSQNVETVLPKLLADSIVGFPELQKQFERDSKSAETYNNLLTDLVNSHSVGESLTKLSSLIELDSNELRLLLNLYANLLKRQLGNESSVGNIAKSLRAIQTAHTELNHNFNTKLVLQEMLINS